MGSPRCLQAQASRFKGSQSEVAIERKAGSALGMAGDSPAQNTGWTEPLAQRLSQTPGMHRVLGPLSTVLAMKGNTPRPRPEAQGPHLQPEWPGHLVHPVL